MARFGWGSEQAAHQRRHTNNRLCTQGDRIWPQHPNPVWATVKIERKKPQKPQMRLPWTGWPEFPMRAPARERGAHGRCGGEDGGGASAWDDGGRRFADQAAERAAHGGWVQVPPVDVPGVRASVAFALEGILPLCAHSI